MSKCSQRVKIKWIIRTFLCANKGKKFTAKQITNFIVENQLHGKQSNMHHRAVHTYVLSDRGTNNGILSNVQHEKKNNRYYYWVE